MTLARWFWACFFFEKKVFWLVKWAKTNAFSSIGKMKLIKMLNYFQPIEFSLSKFDSLDPTYQTSKTRVRKVAKSPFYDAKHFFSKKKNAQNQRAKLIFSKRVKILLCNFENFQQVLENLKLNHLAKEERRWDLETQLWSCDLKNEF